MNRTVVLALVSMVALWRPSPALGQLTVPLERPPIQFGPVAIYPTMAIADIGTDSNVFNDGSAEKEDYTFTLQSRVMTVLAGGPNRLMFQTGSDYVWFRQYKDQRSSNGQYALRADLTWSRFKPFIAADRAKTRARPNAEIDVRARRTERSATAGIDYVISPFTSITAGVRFDDSAYGDGERFRGVDLENALGRSGRSANAGLKFSLTPFTTLTVAGEVQQDRFSGSHLRDSNSFRIAPALELSREAAISGRVAAGYRQFTPVDPTQPDHRGLSVEASLLYSIPGITTFDIQLNRDVSYSYLDTEAFFVNTTAQLAVTQRVYGPFDLKAVGRRDLLSYAWHEDPAPGSSAVARRDTEDVLGGGLQIRIGGNKLGMMVERTIRRSNLSAAERNYDKTRLIGSFTLSGGS